MSDRNPSPAGGPLVEGPRDPEHDATASYALEPEYVASLTKRLAGHDRADRRGRRSPLNGAPLAHIPQSSAADVAEAFARARKAQQAWAGSASTTAPRSCCGCTTWCSTARTRSST